MSFSAETYAVIKVQGGRAGGFATTEQALAAYPHDTATGAAVTVTDGADGVPPKSLTASFAYVQTGSGTPSSENIRAFAAQRGMRVCSDAELAPAATTLRIVRQPTDQGGEIGDTATFRIEAAGNDLQYQWQWYNGSAWANSTLPDYNTPSFSQEINEARRLYAYRCAIREGSGDWYYSKIVRLYETPSGSGPVITQQPEIAYGYIGDTVSFHVDATGTGLTYQWKYRAAGDDGWKNTTASGNQTDTLTVNVTSTRLGYRYCCEVTDGNGVILSATTFIVADRKEPNVLPWALVPFPEDVYAGSLDVLTGDLTVTWGHIAAYDGAPLPGEWASDRDEYASGTTPTAGAEVVYALAEPYTLHCVPVTVRTRAGQNTFAAEPGDSVALDYRADPTLYIDRKLAALLPATPGTDGAYVLTDTVDDGAATLSWESAT